jgi:hypothetical protein
MNARIYCWKTLRVLTFLAFGAASASAVAQSAEYRRGYEKGFQDGQASMERGRGREFSARIHIVMARYGTRDSTCDARDAIESFAGSRRDVEIRVNNDLCGDPAEGRHKVLVVDYRCGDGPRKRIETRESETMFLSCR